VATLIDFTTPFVGGPTFFTGTSPASALVPEIFPVSIDGRPYMLDLASNRFARVFEQRLRDSVDQNNIPGEATINPQGLWRRSQVSWHKGEGQLYADTAEGLDTRFETSKGVDPWTRGQLSLLPATDEKLSSASTNLQMAVAGDTLYVADGQTLKATTDLSTFTSITTGAPAAAITTLCSDGYNVFVGYSGDGLSRTYEGASAVTQYISGSETYTVSAYVKGRLMAAHGGEVHNFTQDVTTSHAHTSGLLFTHPNSAFVFTGFAEGTNHIYMGGYTGTTSLIYRTQIEADGTALQDPVQAGALPIGEKITAMFGYLGFILIGTNKGVRVATSDANGDLVIGPTLETTAEVECFTGDGRFIWYGWTNFDGTSSGLGRLDLSELVGQNEPAYASDLMTDDTGAVRSVVNWAGGRLFSVSGAGLYYESTDLVSSGYLETGTWRWGIPDGKFLAFVDVETQPLAGSVTMSYNRDNEGFVPLASFTTAGGVSRTFDGPESQFREAKFKVTLDRDGTTASLGPVLTRWQARAVPAPSRSELFQVPILLHETMVRFGREFFVDVDLELTKLRQLVSNPRIVNYQEGEETYKVVVENVEWVPVDTVGRDFAFDGTCVVTMRSLVA